MCNLLSVGCLSGEHLLIGAMTEWKCATCSGALSDMERQTLKFVLGMCTITVLSFTWFAGGFGVGF